MSAGSSEGFVNSTAPYPLFRVARMSLIPLLIASLMILLPGVSGHSLAQTTISSRVKDSTQVLDEIMSAPQTRIPPSLLQTSHAIAVIPNVFKIGFILGGRTGRGILIVKDEQRNWAGPVFVTLRGTSIGIQSGVMLSDVVLIFKRSASLEALSSQSLIFGADASIMAGPLSFQVDEMTDPLLPSEIYSYSRGLGLFVGVSLQGASLELDLRRTAAFYGIDDLSLSDVLSGRITELPPEAQGFLHTLAEHSKPRTR